ncbi:MAG: glycine--tRNA ligase [Candidatus Paceibacterota bacterium]
MKANNTIHNAPLENKMDALSALLKRRGYVFQGSLIYGGLAGTYDYGPYGSLLRENLKRLWWHHFVYSRDDMYALDASILMNPSVWVASGHVGGFSDPLVEDVKTHKRYRADHLFEEAGIDAAGKSTEEMNILLHEGNVKSPEGNPLGDVRDFNMMFETKVGAAEDTSSVTYLRPETAQGIFVNFKNIVDTFHPRIPFGIGQIGKAFRNEITPRDFIFRLREMEQMEVEYFVREEEWEKHFEVWRRIMWDWIDLIGLSRGSVSEHEIDSADLAHYSKRTIDFEFAYPFGTKELYGLAYRTNYDLTKHSEHSGVKLEYFDESTKERFIPHVIEPSLGLDRTMLAVLLDAYTVDTLGGEEREYLNLSWSVAPVKVAVFPLLKNKSELVEKARDVFTTLRRDIPEVRFDDNGNIGKRYRRQDEIGTPFCVTIDFDTLTDETVTVRERNSGEQVRVPLSELSSHLLSSR